MMMLLVQTSGYSQETVGWLEKEGINLGEMRLGAKLDTGAKTTSLGYSSIHFFQKEGSEWVSVGVTNKKIEPWCWKNK